MSPPPTVPTADRPHLDPAAMDRAARLHRAAICIDGHSDVLMVIADGKMRLGERVAVPSADDWSPPPGVAADALSALYHFSPHTTYFQTMGFYDIPRFREGGLTAQACAIYLTDAECARALHRALEMVYWLRREADDNPDFRLITSVADIRQIKQAGHTGGFLTFEGFEPLGYDLKLLDLFYDLGLRMASLTHSRRNAFADGSQRAVATGGLTDLGQRAVTRMNELGIVIDLAHLNLRGCWEVLGRSTAPVVLSHAGVRRLFAAGGEVEHAGRPSMGTADRPLRELLDAIAAGGGVVGVIAYGQPDLAAIVADIAFVIDAVGPDHVGLGSDFFGFDRAPTGFGGMHELPNLTAALVAQGYSDEVIIKILGENYLRVFAQIWR